MRREIRRTINYYLVVLVLAVGIAYLLGKRDGIEHALTVPQLEPGIAHGEWIYMDPLGSGERVKVTCQPTVNRLPRIN